MKVTPGVHALARAEFDRALEALRGTDVRLIELPRGIASATGFFDAVVGLCPLNPPLVRVTDSWDALSDSLFGGLSEVDEPLVVLAWADPSVFAAADPRSSRIAVEILSGLPDELSDPKMTAGYTKDVTILLGDR